MMNKFNDIKNEAKEKINQLTKKNKGNNDKIIESPEQNQNLVNANEFKEFSLPIDV